MSTPMRADSPNQAKMLKEIFADPNEKVLKNKSKVVAKLHNNAESIATFARENNTGYLTISTKKHILNDVNAIDQETWQEIGQMLKELMAKIEENSSCRDFGIEMKLGKEAVKT